MISSKLLPPEVFGDDGPDGVTDAHIDTQRLGAGHLKHKLTLEARRGEIALWKKEIAFEVEAPFEVPDLVNDDPFLIASVFPAMEVGGMLRVHGRVSRALIRNLLGFQGIWSSVMPSHFRGVAIAVDEIDDPSAPRPEPLPKAILAFSGGLDSMLALWRNASGDAGPVGYDIRATLFIHAKRFGVGMEPDSSDVIEKLRKASARRELPMAVVHTNISEVVGNTSITHGTWLAACLTLFAGKFDVGLLGSSVAYFSPGYEIYGSHPLIDPLLSTGHMAIRNDEGLYTRPDKAAMLARYPEAIEDLRVCIHPYRTETNCCRCEKCIRTMLCFVASGNPIPPVFPDGLRLTDIGIGMGQLNGLTYASMILEHAKRKGTSQEKAMRVLHRRYQQKKAKIVGKDLLKWVTGQKPRHRWHVLDDL